MLTTGQIVFAVGLAGLAASLIATIVTTKTYHKNEKKLREDIWREYKYGAPQNIAAMQGPGDWRRTTSAASLLRNPATPPPTMLPSKIHTFEVLPC